MRQPNMPDDDASARSHVARFARRLTAWVMFAALALASGCGDSVSKKPTAAGAAGSVTLLAAASTSDATTELARRFEEETKIKVTISSGGSNMLAKQIISGEPVDLFLSASQEWASAVETKGLAASSHSLLTNRLVLIVPQGNPDKITSPDDLKSPRLANLALAGEKVPAGKYADQALRSLNLLDVLTSENKIARGQDVRGALTYVELGECSAGIVYATDARISQRVEIVYTFPKELHDEVIYPLVLLKQGANNPAAKRFDEYLRSDAALAVFEQFGFQRLGEKAK